jgi:hypothetical protein
VKRGLPSAHASLGGRPAGFQSSQSTQVQNTGESNAIAGSSRSQVATATR